MSSLFIVALFFFVSSCCFITCTVPSSFTYSCTLDTDSTDWKPDQFNYYDIEYSQISDFNKYKPPYSQGDKVPTALVINSVPGGIVKTTFFPLMDQFSMMQVVNSTDTIWLDGSDSTRVRVEQIGARSPSRRRSAGCTHRVPFWTLVVTMEDGYITKQEWDDDCSLCSLCSVEGTCGEDESICVDYNCASQPVACTSRGGPTDCDLKIYIGWTGTDKNGVYLTSAGKRLSQFRKWSLNAAYNAASQFSSQNLPTPPTEISQCPTGAPDANGNCVG